MTVDRFALDELDIYFREERQRNVVVSFESLTPIQITRKTVPSAYSIEDSKIICTAIPVLSALVFSIDVLSGTAATLYDGCYRF